MMAAVPNDNSTQNIVLPEHFKVFGKGATFTREEDAVKQQIISILGPYGVKKLNLGSGARSNHIESTKQKFPHKRWVWFCGSCDKKAREMDDSKRGCCGLKIRFLLQDKKEDQQPHLEVMEFNLPLTSNHLLVTKEARQLSESKVIKSQAELSPIKLRLLENMGKSRSSAELARNVLFDQHGVTLSKNLLFRVMQRGRDSAWGGNDTESLTIFHSEGMKLRELCTKYGVCGKFDTKTHNTTGKLLGWYAQHPLEVLNARTYANDAVFVDTTHNATSYSYKTGPPAVIDCFGHTAPCGMFQVPEEEIDSVAELMRLLELDVLGATCCTDGGPAWPEIARMFRQPHIEDTWHNCENGGKKAASLSSKEAKKKFGQLKNKVLYQVLDQQELSDAFSEMRLLAVSANGSDELGRWIDRMEEGQTLRTATHATKFFSCSAKGCLSRCEQMMSKLKNSGTSKREMKHWTLGELQNRHLTKVCNYETEVTEEIEDAIKVKRDLSRYVLDWESVERTRGADGLEIVTTMEGAPNPFRLQSTKRVMQEINLERPEGNTNFGLTLTLCNTTEELCPNLHVKAIKEGSFCQSSMLEVGMRIYKVNGKSFSTFAEGVELMKSTDGQLSLTVEKPPSIGTVYTIQRKGKGEEQKMLRTVFIPDSDDLHCQSNYHVHTCSFIRCRYIQRALIDHKTRSMNDLSTIHSRWHIKNSPMYQVVYNNLVTLMKVDGLGDAALPAFLTPAPNPTECAHSSIADTGDTDEDSVEEISQKLVVPSTKVRRFNDVNFIIKPILELAKEDAEVFRMVVPQLKQMYQNSLMIARSKSKKVQNAKNKVAASGASLPIMPDEIRKKRDKTDDMNMANTKKQKNVKKKRAKKAKLSQRSKKDDNDGRPVSSREEESGDDDDDDDDDNITLAALGGKK